MSLLKTILEMDSIGGSLSELYIEENFGGGKLRIQDFTEPLLIIEYFEESEKTELLRKSLHQLLAISEKYKNILLISHHESLKIILNDVTVFFQDRKFFFGFQRQLKRPEFYRISFFSQRKLQYFKISVEIGERIKVGLIHSSKVLLADSHSECNVYSEDPHNPVNKPWTVPPTNSTNLVSKVQKKLTNPSQPLKPLTVISGPCPCPGT